jgi:hypothetical protein
MIDINITAAERNRAEKFANILTLSGCVTDAVLSIQESPMTESQKCAAICTLAFHSSGFRRDQAFRHLADITA